MAPADPAPTDPAPTATAPADPAPTAAAPAAAAPTAAAPGAPSPQRTPTCAVCGDTIVHAQVDEQGLCGPCGLRLRLRRLPPAGARCVLCGERRRRSLTLWPLSGDVVCHTCDFYLRETRPWPEDLAPLARRLRRDRRTQGRHRPERRQAGR
jgi:hypothetical protein